MNADDRRYFESMLKTITQSVDTVAADVAELKQDMKTYSEKVTVLEKNELKHPQGCPQNKEVRDAVAKVDKMHEDLEEYRVAKKYPKLAVALVLAVSISMLIYGFIALEKVDKIAEKYGIVDQK